MKELHFQFAPNLMWLSLEKQKIWDIGEVCRSKKKDSTTILLNYEPIWIRCMDAVFQLLVVEMSQEKNLRKNPQFWATFVFCSIFKSLIWLGTTSLGSLVHKYGPMIISSIFAISQLSVVKMSWGKKSKKKLMLLVNFCFLFYFEFSFFKHFYFLVELRSWTPRCHCDWLADSQFKIQKWKITIQNLF